MTKDSNFDRLDHSQIKGTSMARRNLAKRKKKTVRFGSAASAHLNVKYYGSEKPIPQGREITQQELGSCLNWYSAMCDASHAREWLLDYYVGIGESKKAELIKQIPDSALPLTAGWLARITLEGGILSVHSKNFMRKLVDNSFKFIKDANEEIVKKPNIQDHMREKVSEMIGEIEGMIDDGYTEGLYEFLNNNEFPPLLTKRIADHFRPQAEEARAVMTGDDPQLVEGYAYMSKKQLAGHLKMLDGYISDAERHATNSKKLKPRAPRIKKPVPPEKRVKRLRFQKEEIALKIASVPPTRIIGAQELWMLNTKNRLLTVLRAIDRGGIDVRGNRYFGFDEKISVSKRVRESKIDETLSLVLKGGKVAKNKLMDSLKTKPAGLQYRGNETTVLLYIGL